MHCSTVGCRQERPHSGGSWTRRSIFAMGAHSMCPRKTVLFQLCPSTFILTIWTCCGPTTAQVRQPRRRPPCDCSSGQGNEVACRTEGGTGATRWPQNHTTRPASTAPIFLVCWELQQRMVVQGKSARFGGWFCDHRRMGGCRWRDGSGFLHFPARSLMNLACKHALLSTAIDHSCVWQLGHGAPVARALTIRFS